MSVTLTEEQTRAIEARGRVIVSASAGSGKTFVMIERLVSLISEGADVTRALAVTFTKKAAAQMKERLRSALIKKLSSAGEQERARLKAQLAALPLADISTIHAFCARLIRTRFYLADVDPAFRVVDAEDHEGALILSRALDEVFEWGYEEKDPAFLRLLSVYFRSKKDAKLREILLSLYAKLRERADYRAVLEEMGKEDNFSSVCDYLAADVHERAAYLAENARENAAYFLSKNPKAAAVCTQIAEAAEALASGDLFSLCALPFPKIGNMPSSAKAEGETLRRMKYAGKLSAAVKELYQSLAKYAAREEEYARYLDGNETARALASVLLRFDDIYGGYKKEGGVLDYNDLEHLALKVLSNEDARAAVREKYQYVFVDEYQDVNPAQEQILSLLCGEEVFLVGDAKQSIYAFRGSRSEYFLNKCREFSALSLTENFRSSAEVLECVNRVFSYAMTEKSCGIAYADAPMRGGKRYGDHAGGVFFHTVVKRKEEKKERGIYSVLGEREPRTDEQAQLLCRLIEEEVGSEWFDADEGLVKPLGFGDIAVLVRAGDSGTDNIVAALAERNIPVSTAATVNVCDFWEARLIIDFLSYLDNGEQDIPLAGALLSRIGGLTDGELARIRLRFPEAPAFRDACREYAKCGDAIAAKLNTFAQKAEHYRNLMRVKTAAEMIGLLLADGLEAEIAAKADGEARLRRVLRLTEEAEGSVNAFLRRLKTLDYRVKYAEGGGENAVKVLTMHSSKGLEYPVVFLVGLDTAFRGNARDDVLYSDRFLFAPRSYDLAARTVRETVLRRASLLLEDRETVKGELNLLYVAMTRAKFRLHMLFRDRKGALAPEYAERFSDFIDFYDCADYFAADAGEEQPAPPRSALVYKADETLLEQLRAVYQRPYPFESSVLLPVKSSATDLLRLARTDADEDHSVRARMFGAEGGASVEEGLAYHAFLEHVRFGGDAEEELARMEKEGELTSGQLALLDPRKLKKILALPSIAALKGKRVLREQTFLVSLPARELPALGTDAEDEIVFQGALDLLCEDGEGYLILDYKYSAHGAEQIKADYAPQIGLYRKAVAKTMGVDISTVRARIINILGLFEVEM